MGPPKGGVVCRRAAAAGRRRRARCHRRRRRHRVRRCRVSDAPGRRGGGGGGRRAETAVGEVLVRAEQQQRGLQRHHRHHDAAPREAGREELAEEEVAERRAEAGCGGNLGELRGPLLLAVHRADDLDRRAPSDGVRKRIEQPHVPEDVDGRRGDRAGGGREPHDEDGHQDEPATQPVGEGGAQQLAAQTYDGHAREQAANHGCKRLAKVWVGEDRGLE
mmetsp:Transcript_7459/g.24835  ORF Transcript_7459/g.24835 Transcript_7459/m.24835 type:complete len:219 (-) Transcript_7459:117-773(-)